MAKVTNLKLEMQKGSSDIIFASWDFSGSNLDYYKVNWYYSSGNGVWFEGGTSNASIKSDTYTVPSNSTWVKVRVTPVAKTHKVNGEDTPYWTGTQVSCNYQMSTSPPAQLNTPTVTINKYKLTATVDVTDGKTDQVYFYILKGEKKFKSSYVTVKNQRASFSCDVDAGGKYRVRCRGVNVVDDNKVYGPWSEYCDEVSTIPAAMGEVTLSVESKTSVKLSWPTASTATGYEVEYTTNKRYFGSSNEVQSMKVDVRYAYVTGLEPGNRYYFRVRATNANGESGWSKIVSTILGTDPVAPTTWSSTTTAMVGENVTLYWVHNSEDGSKQKSAEVEITINGVTTVKTVTFDTSVDEQETSSYVLSLASYTDGAEILWRVRTKGITDVYGEWSVQRTIHLYAPPTVQVDLCGGTELLTAFPLAVKATAGPTSQKPISFHISIKATATYEIDDETGTRRFVKMGDVLYSKSFNATGHTLNVEISAGDVNLKNNQSYELVVTVGMDSGLIAETPEYFEVSWGDDNYQPDASVSIDDYNMCAYIFPYCRDSSGALIDDVVLAVYRRDYNGGFTLVANELDNNGYVGVVDPHPSLDYARYRIVARNKNTSVVGYEDLSGVPINAPYIVIQWDESYSRFNYEETDDALEIAPWSGSMVCLPYNVDTTEDNDPDVSLVKYIGRKHPVTYYGTHLNEGATWSTEIEADDKETLYALRRLRSWMGDVYVREPSGTGYWAQVKVSISTTHCELTIPVTFTVKRVEGGV